MAFPDLHRISTVEHVLDDRTQSTQQQRWHTLIHEIGSEIAGPLTSAVERIHALTSTGRINPHDLRALRDEVEAARQAGIIGQQLARFASGRSRQSPERLELTDVLTGILVHRMRETQSRQIAIAQSLKPAEVVADAALLFGLLNTLLDWSLANALSNIEFKLDLKAWPLHARLVCHFMHRRPADAPGDGLGKAMPSTLDSLNWRLLEQTAWTMGLIVERKDEREATTLALEFPHTIHPASHRGADIRERNDGFEPSTNSQPLAGSHVLVIASRREMRVLIRDALRSMSLIVDFVNSVDEAAGFCRDGLPHAIIIESIQNGVRFAEFRDDIVDEVPGVAFIEVIEEGSAFEMSSPGSAQITRVGRDALAHSLPSALLFELSKGS